MYTLFEFIIVETEKQDETARPFAYLRVSFEIYMARAHLLQLWLWQTLVKANNLN